MACKELPEYLTPLTEGYENKIVNNLLASDFDDGWQKRRPLTTALKKEFTVKYLICSKAKIKEFEQWYKDEIKLGSQNFLVYDIVCEKKVLARLIPTEINFTPEDQHLYRFSVILRFERLI